MDLVKDHLLLAVLIFKDTFIKQEPRNKSLTVESEFSIRSTPVNKSKARKLPEIIGVGRQRG